MGKKILVILGSPRKGANTTLMAEAFIKGAQKKGHVTEIFDVNKNKSEGCKACNQCWSKGTACVFEDSFNGLVEKIKKSEVIVVASPVYWGSFPSPLKAYIDKMYSFCVPWCKLDISNKQPVLLTSGDGDEETAFAQIKTTYDVLAAYMKWYTPKVICVPKLVDAGSVINTDGIRKAEILGEHI